MKKGEHCYNDQILCPHQIDDNPCGECEYKPKEESEAYKKLLAWAMIGTIFNKGRGAKP